MKKRWILKSKINPDLYGVLYRMNLRYLVSQAVTEITPYGMDCFKTTADRWTKDEMKDKQKCLRSLLKQGRYIIVKNHDRYVAIDTVWLRKLRKDR